MQLISGGCENMESGLSDRFIYGGCHNGSANFIGMNAIGRQVSVRLHGSVQVYHFHFFCFAQFPDSRNDLILYYGLAYTKIIFEYRYGVA